ncbi:RDD domain containing protein [Turneriella parva DSM 21527]|uniref:RDD domain containing protein n=1 Tax=Turneriella parva (strain ATCC BAA-1111 / DSM 21527 / NCTC 11395 / H) TaxID=869212 RepID=I4B3X9_TURPD|nr:RDD domain containing protein [Turneriella parva DSM 21527]
MPAKSGTQFIIGILIYSVLYVSYSLILNWKFGGTIGKILVGLRVKSIDGSAIKLNQALRRSSVDFIFQMIQVMQFHALIKQGQIDILPDVSLSAMRASMYDQKNILTDSMFYVEIAWLFSEFISMQFNEKKRALHDFIAGTIVLTEFRRTKGPKALMWVIGLLFLTFFAGLSMSASDDTVGKIPFQSPLWSAKSPQEIRSMLTEHDIAPTNVNAFGQNILHVAAKTTDTRTFGVFLHAYPELINTSDFFGDSPGHIASRFSPEKLELMKNTGLMQKKINRFGEANIP